MFLPPVEKKWLLTKDRHQAQHKTKPKSSFHQGRCVKCAADGPKSHKSAAPAFWRDKRDGNRGTLFTWRQGGAACVTSRTLGHKRSSSSSTKNASRTASPTREETRVEPRFSGRGGTPKAPPGLIQNKPHTQRFPISSAVKRARRTRVRTHSLATCLLVYSMYMCIIYKKKKKKKPYKKLYASAQGEREGTFREKKIDLQRRRGETSQDYARQFPSPKMAARWSTWFN